MLLCLLTLSLLLNLAHARFAHDITLLTPRAPTGVASGSDNQCCFIIQDHVSVNYWGHNFTTTWHGLRKITSVISTVTQFQDTAITNYETKTTVKNTTYITSWEVAEDWVYASNNAPGPTLAATRINATKTTINDRVITSPVGFFAYPSVKVLHVPALAQANGELACTTSSTYFLKCPAPVDSVTFSGINSHIQSYYGAYTASNQTSTYTYTNSLYSTKPGPTPSYVPITNQTTFTVTNTRSVFNVSHAKTSFSTSEIIFPTPYLYFPSRGKTEHLDTGDLPEFVGQSTPAMVARAISTPTSRTTTTYDPLLADYGYVPQVVIDSLASEHPDLSSCLPGGPSIIPIKDHEPWINIINDGCDAAAPGVVSPIPDLTTSSGATVKGLGCFHPGNCAIASSTPAPASTVPVDLPESTKAPQNIPTSPSLKLEAPTISIGSIPNPMSNLAPFFGHSASDHTTGKASHTKSAERSTIPEIAEGNSQEFNPTETAKPATVSGSEEVTAGSEKASFAPSLGLPAIVIASTTSAPSSAEKGSVITTAGHTFRFELSDSAVEVAGHTLTLGSSAVTISGTPISLGSSDIVIGSSTVALPESTHTIQGLGGIIAGAFGPHRTTTQSASAGSFGSTANGSATSPLVFQGIAEKVDDGLAKLLGILGATVAFSFL